MKDKNFRALIASVREAGRIRRGETAPTREFRYDAKSIRAIRAKLGKSQTEFARMIGVKVSTLRNWEQGRREPDGPARALLRVAASDPDTVAFALSGSKQR